MNEAHDILMIVHNRAEYTEMALARLLESCDGTMRVWVWQNGNHRRTGEIVRSMSNHPRFHHLEHSSDNKKLREPTNWFWRESPGAWLSKVDDDCLLPDGWGAKLREAHQANPKLGVIGCWRFYDDDFEPNLARKKIVELEDGTRLMRNCWVQGSGYVIKRACREGTGFLQPDESFTNWCIRAALAGWENGWLFPFIHEEHMDDPRSPYCLVTTDEQFVAQRPLSAVNDNVTTVEEWAERVRYMARSAQAATPDPRHYVGWRRVVRRVPQRLSRMLGRREPWRVKKAS